MHMCATPGCTYIVALQVPYYCSDRTRMRCPKCVVDGCTSCRVTPYHNNKTCAAYQEEKRLARELEEKLTGIIDPEHATQIYMEVSGAKQCKKCNIYMQMTHGCFKMKCRCGYRFCYKCDTENARCGCTPSSHGFWDNIDNRGDFSNLR